MERKDVAAAAERSDHQHLPSGEGAAAFPRTAPRAVTPLENAVMRAERLLTAIPEVEPGDPKYSVVGINRATLRELLNGLSEEQRDAGALANAVSRYIDGGCNDEEGLHRALSAWAQREAA
jgi:hypothetical protein